jgi:N-acetyl-anhydromuramyl-L-alanine amidase AmpD
LKIPLIELRDNFIFERGLYSDYRNYTLFDHKIKPIVRDVSSSASKVNKLVFHCTDASGWSPEKLSNFFVSERNFFCCSYHYYITTEKVFHMVDENVITWHAGNFNPTSIGFSIDYAATRDEKLQVKIDPKLIENASLTAVYLLIKGQGRILPKNLFGHRELPITGWVWNKKHDNKLLRKTCPGMAIDLDKFRYDTIRLLQTKLVELTDIEMPIDGIFGTKTLTQLQSIKIQ